MQNKADIFLDLFTPHKAKLWRFCLSVSKTRENAQDLLQDTIETAYRQFDKLNAEIAFLSYLFTVASRLNYKNFKNPNQICELDENLIENLIDKNTMPDDRLDIKIMYEFLDKMKYEYKEAIILIEIMGFTHAEACEIQHISIDAFRKRLYRAKNMLRDIMQPDITNSDLKLQNQLNSGLI